jgi:galactose mutarotase-like enzyme
METIVIENEVLRVGVMPDCGARIVSLFDKRAGREWMAEGAPSANTGEDAVYGAAEAIGWDECFPTVAPWDAQGTVWGRRLRDHGDVWGRPSNVSARSATALTTTLADATYRFSRRLELSGGVLTASYEVENLADREMPYLWALHGLLAVTPADRIVIGGVDSVVATYLGDNDRILPPGSMGWPDTKGRLPFALDEVQPASQRFAGKFYMGDVPSRRASVGHDGAFLTLGWEAGLSLGIWLNYGGWPAAGGPHHLALEPTSAPADHLGEAVAAGTAVVVPAGGRHKWAVTLTLAEEARP